VGAKPLRRWGHAFIVLFLAACPAFLAAGPAQAADPDLLDGSDLWVVHDGHYCGYKDGEGQTVIAPKYGYARDFSEGLAAVQIGNKWGFINPQGVMVIKPEYDTVLHGNNEEQDFYQGTCLVKQDPAFFLIDRKGGIVTAFSKEIREMKGFSEEGLAPARHNHQNQLEWGYVDRQGKLIVPFQFREAYGFRDGLALVRSVEGFGFINKAGKIVIAPRFEEAGEFHDGLASFRSGNTYGFIDKSGKTVIPARFKQVGDFGEDLAQAWLKAGLESVWIDKTGSIVPREKIKQIMEASRDRLNWNKHLDHIKEQKKIRHLRYYRK
jgi:bifunctional DNA-binding transcriptional regulator/antitoxin component of YhaV-PrlF toxin-antitoxin module